MGAQESPSRPGPKVVFQDPGDGLTKQVDIAKFKQDMMFVVVPGRPPANFKRA